MLAEGAQCGCAKTRGMCAKILEVEEALWTFTREEGLEPTNNAAERALRTAVIKRKKSFGSHSAAGCVFIARLLSVAQTLRQRGVTRCELSRRSAVIDACSQLFFLRCTCTCTCSPGNAPSMKTTLPSAFRSRILAPSLGLRMRARSMSSTDLPPCSAPEG